MAMLDVHSLALAALLGAALPLALWGAELAFARFLPSPWQRGRRTRMRGWLLLATIWAMCSVGLFAWNGFVRTHGALALQLTFAAWAVGSGVFAQRAYWLIYRSAWIGFPGGRSLTALGQLVLLVLCESLAVTVFAEDMRAWLSPSLVTEALQQIGTLASEALLVVFAGMLVLGMLGLLFEREPLWQ